MGERYTLLDHWSVYDREAAGTYPFEIPTGALSPGFYDIHLTFPGGASQRVRVEVVT